MVSVTLHLLGKVLKIDALIKLRLDYLCINYCWNLQCYFVFAVFPHGINACIHVALYCTHQLLCVCVFQRLERCVSITTSITNGLSEREANDALTAHVSVYQLHTPMITYQDSHIIKTWVHQGILKHRMEF